MFRLTYFRKDLILNVCILVVSPKDMNNFWKIQENMSVACMYIMYVQAIY